MNYTINVASAGTYTVQLRVASPSGGSMHVGFNGASNVWQSIGVPNSGGWQSWTTVSITATLGAGTQQMTLLSDTGGYNVDSIAISAGGSSPSPAPAPTVGPPSPPSGGGATLPVAEWNIQINDNSESHARLAMDMLLASSPRPEVIVIVEAYQQWYGTYIDELQRQTGQTWYGAFATHCAPGDWNGSTCSPAWYQGVGIFSTHPITSSSVMYFPYADCWTSARVGLRAQIDLNGLPVQVFTTHLQTGGCTNDAQARYNSMRDLKAWASQFSAPQLVAGDFNADADQIDTPSGMTPNFVDSWPIAGSGFRFSALLPNPNMKLDYWFSDASMRATPISSFINTGTGSVSDHYPVYATFSVH
jgi:endonuclease/exonuclease/phosphatase family metal-dependent hydrolase